MKKLMLLLLFYGFLNASLIEILGGQKVGTTSMVFLKIGVGARATSLGEAYVSLAEDATSPYWNPAGIAFIKRKTTGFSNTFWAVDINHSAASFILPLDKYTSFSLFASFLNTDYMKETDEYHPEGTGRYFQFGDYLLGVSIARLISERFSFGLNIKALMEDLYKTKSYGFAIDLGTLYHVGYRDIKVGVSLMNMGPDIRPKGNGEHYEAFSLPIIYRMGVSGYIYKKLLLAFQIEKPSDNVETFRAGAEYRLKNISLRTGYKLNNRGPGRDFLASGLSLGVGFRLKLGKRFFVLDYSRTGMGYFGDVSRLSLEVR